MFGGLGIKGEGSSSQEQLQAPKPALKGVRGENVRGLENTPAGGSLEQPSRVRPGQVVNRREAAHPLGAVTDAAVDVVLEKGAGGPSAPGARRSRHTEQPCRSLGVCESIRDCAV